MALATACTSRATVWIDDRQEQPPESAPVQPVCLEPTVTTLTWDTEGAAERPVIARTPTGAAMVWQERRSGRDEAMLARLDTTGARVGEVVQISTAGGRWPWVVAVNEELAAVWQEPVASPAMADVYFARFSPTLEPIDGTRVIATNGDYTARPRVAWNGTELAVTWTERITALFLALDATGTPLGDPSQPVNGGDCLCQPSVAWTGSLWAVVWHNDGFGCSPGYKIGFQLVDRTGVPSGDISCISQGGWAFRPKITRTAAGLATVYSDSGSGSSEIYIAPLDLLGNPVMAPVTLAPTDTYSRFPTTVWTGTALAAIWSDDGEIVGAWRAAVGTRLSPDFAISNTPQDSRLPSVIWVGDRDLLVAWSEDPPAIGLARVGCAD